MLNNNYNPDVLSCLANLSNDEVFTPPKLANDILDLLPNEIWSDPNITFLDPVCKSGVFLREIAKRLDKGLEKVIKQKQKRINHIFTKQIFGIAITELTSLMTRRTIYGSKNANSKFSFCEAFESSNGNIFFKRMDHSWEQGRCIYCGGTKDIYERDSSAESYAYNFIHINNPEDIFNMKFDVIIGNPPYQLSDGGAQASAIPIYHKFVLQAIKLNPRYLVMITPSRWFAGGRGLDEFRNTMLHDGRIREIHDFIRGEDVFPGVQIKGGVSYFLWQRETEGECKVFSYEDGKLISKSSRPLLEKGADCFVRYNEAISILRKVLSKNEESFSQLVSSQKPFGLRGFFSDFQEKEFKHSVKLYLNQKIGWIRKDQIELNENWVDKYKILIPRNSGIGSMKKDILKPIIAGPNTCCTETYLVIGPFEDEESAQNACSYIHTRFFHLLLALKKVSQGLSKNVFSFIPIQDFSRSWSDKDLFRIYNLSKEEILYIENNIPAFD
jgi:site-specific DNA-methyltransferase (adenine-specific)